MNDDERKRVCITLSIIIHALNSDVSLKQIGNTISEYFRPIANK